MASHKVNWSGPSMLYNVEDIFMVVRTEFLADLFISIILAG